MAWLATGSSAAALSRTRTGSTSAPRAAKCDTPIAAQRWNTSSPSGYDAVGRIATRGLVRPVAASRLASNSDIVGRNLPAPTIATGPGIASRVYLRHCRDDVATALDPRRDDHRLRRGLFLRDHTPHRATPHRSRATRHVRRCPRGADVRHQRLSR